MYSLSSGIVLHTFVHGLTQDGDMHPSTFMPRGFAFCGATVDGTVTLWDIKVGDRLQAVQHLCTSMPPMFSCVIGSSFYKLAQPFVQLLYVPRCYDLLSTSVRAHMSSHRFTWQRRAVSCFLQQHLKTKSGSGTLVRDISAQ